MSDSSIKHSEEVGTLSPSPGVVIAIVTPENEHVGNLSAFTRTTSADSAVVEMLTSWRNRYRESFLTQFEATVPRTRDWIEHTILADPTRLMFLIHEQAGDPIGHVGVLRLDRPIVELDNMIRGRSGDNVQLMYWAEVALLRWLFKVKQVSGVCLQVLTSNWIPIGIHTEIGFRMTERSPIVRRELPGEVRLVTETGGDELLKVKLGKMALTAEEFFGFLNSKWTGASDVER